MNGKKKIEAAEEKEELKEVLWYETDVFCVWAKVYVYVHVDNLFQMIECNCTLKEQKTTFDIFVLNGLQIVMLRIGSSMYVLVTFLNWCEQVRKMTKNNFPEQKWHREI